MVNKNKENKESKRKSTLAYIQHPGIKDRINIAAQQLGSRKKAAEAAGVTTDTLQRWIRGDINPSFNAIVGLAAAAGVRLEWLAYDQQPMAISDRGATPGHYHDVWQSDSPDDADGRYAHIPRYGEVIAAAGHGAVVDSEQVTDWLWFKKEWIHKELNAQPNDLYLIMVDGESMEPTLRPGDTILIDRRDAQRIPRDGIYVLRMEHTLLVKRLQRLPGKQIKVTSDNAAYEPFNLDLSSDDDVVIIGRVVWAGRRF